MNMTAPMYSITWHKVERLLRLTWRSGTEGMTDEDFRETLEVFADGAIQHEAKRLPVMEVSLVDLLWHNRHVSCGDLVPDRPRRSPASGLTVY